MMSRQTGAVLDELDHIKQSIQDILLTPIGSRVMRREYGSLLFELIDSPANDTTLIQLFAATAAALARWETRIQLESVSISMEAPGKFIVDLDGVLTNSNQQTSLSIPLQFGAIA